MFVAFFGSVVTIWSLLRLLRPRLEHGLADGQARLAFLSHEQDEVMRAFMLFLTAADYEAALRRLEATALRPTLDARAFFNAGADHMLLTPVTACLPGADYVASQVVSTGTPVGLDTWLQQQFSGDP